MVAFCLPVPRADSIPFAVPYRKRVEMRYCEEMSYEEIAEELDMPLGTVKVQLFRARDLLYNILITKKEFL